MAAAVRAAGTLCAPGHGWTGSIENCDSDPITGCVDHDDALTVHRMHLFGLGELATMLNLSHTLRRLVRGVQPMNNKRRSHESFAVIERSGAVSVELGRLLKSDVGRGQLGEIRTLREHTQRDSGKPEGSTKKK